MSITWIEQIRAAGQGRCDDVALVVPAMFAIAEVMDSVEWITGKLQSAPAPRDLSFI